MSTLFYSIVGILFITLAYLFVFALFSVNRSPENDQQKSDVSLPVSKNSMDKKS